MIPISLLKKLNSIVEWTKSFANDSRRNVEKCIPPETNPAAPVFRQRIPNYKSAEKNAKEVPTLVV